eukprot:COSAG01_NODE_398_length_17547_cov_206.793501_18_plen_305_part_00
MNFVFLMDPMDSIQTDKDTSYALIQAAIKMNINCFHLAPENIMLQHDSLKLLVTPILSPKKIKPVLLDVADIQAIFIRLDPPMNTRYLNCTWLLDRYADKIFMMNDPSGIRLAQEKTWCMQFKNIIPDTLVSANLDALLDFAKQYPRVIAKPYDQYGGLGVFSLSSSDPNLKVALEMLTQQGQACCIVQPFIPEATQGDKRILLLNGEPLGAILRLHSSSDHRNNFFAGGKAVACDITKQDLAIISQIKSPLKANKLHFVGIDILGDKLIEINVTSPTCIQEMMHFQQEDLATKVIEYTLAKIH